MEWTDEGIIIGVRRLGEGNAIVEAMTLAHGRHLGLVRGGTGSRLRPTLQPGNTLGLVWRARLDEHLGNYAVEGLRLRAAEFLPLPHAMFGLVHLCGLVRLLPERDPHADLYREIKHILGCLHEPRAAAVALARFELRLLADLGFGLELDRCAASGSGDDLIYVSPKSGRAVSRSAGDPWRERLLPLPAFLHAEEENVSAEALAESFMLTAFFLTRHVLEPRGSALPVERAQFVAAVMRLLHGAEAGPDTPTPALAVASCA
jgi:DNA repair protein RecO (recombination protein O)